MQLFSWAYKRGATSMPPLALVSALAYFRTAYTVGQRDLRFRFLVCLLAVSSSAFDSMCDVDWRWSRGIGYRPVSFSSSC